jgi:Tfp pilus assembly protein PilF
MIAANLPLPLLLRKAFLHAGSGRFKQAEEMYLAVLKQDSNHTEALYQLGLVKIRQEETEEAISLLERVLILSPLFFAAAKSLSELFMLRNLEEKAKNVWRKYLDQTPGDLNVLLQTGCTLHLQGFFEEAIRIYRLILEKVPNHYQTLCHLGLALSDLGEHEEGVLMLNKSLELAPLYSLAKANRSVILLLLGRYKEGWIDYENCRLQEGFQTNPAIRTPCWNGEERKEQRLLLIAEQGAGDSIQFIRYLPLIQERVKEVTLYCRSDLSSIFINSFPGINFKSSQESVPAHDVHLYMMDCPRIFGAEPKDIPKKIPYLFPTGEKINKWKDLISCYSHLKVGVAWAGNPRHRKDRERSILPLFLSPLWEIEGVDFFSLQKEGKSSLEENLPLIDFSNNFTSFDDTAALINELDLVITVDTSIAHLAGALGKPVWILLPFVPDWRWELEKKENNWYPTARLFRQKKPKDWASCIEEAKRSLQAKRFQS